MYQKKFLQFPGDEKYPCKSQGECGEGACKFGFQSTKNEKVDICECDVGWINHDGKPCSYELKPKLTAFLISFFVGWLGADWFYLAQGSGAYICAGVFKLLTLGGLGIWALVGKPIFTSRKQEL